MAEGIAFSIFTNLVTKLGAAATGELGSMYSLEDELGKFKDTLSTIEAALVDADERKEESDSIQDWIRMLNNAVYLADEVLDAFAAKALQQRDHASTKIKVRQFFSSSNQLVFRYKMSRRLNKIRERVEEIAANMSTFNFLKRTLVEESVNNDDRETDYIVSASEIIGRDEDKEEIILKLIMSSSSNNEENVSVIPIIGIGGLGKTALAQLVYGDERVVKHFDLRLWVCVSEKFEMKSLVRKMLKSATKKEVQKLELDQLQIRLQEELDGKKYLLILDDVWNEQYDKWVNVKHLLMGGAKGSKIVATTRSETVASVMRTENPYMLKALTKDQSWTLFEKVIIRKHKRVHPKLKIIGQEIIERCQGVPLAIRSLASVMQSKKKESEWLSILNSDIWSLCQDGSHILPILKLSYDHLPMHLRQCFSYCSIFPKDHDIQKDTLIQLWMAEGYVQSSGSQRFEEIGDHYFRILMSRSFFQDVKVDDYSHVRSCKMHDLIHDLAVKVSGSDCSNTETNEGNLSERVNHVSYVDNLENFPTQLLKAKGLKTLLRTCDDINRENLLQASEIKLISSSYFRCLRVLDLHNSSVQKVSDSIGKLQHLRYLDLSFNGEMTVLPNSISRLINLQTLKLRGCTKLERLPPGITKLINLSCLTNDVCWKLLDHMPTGLGKLTSLRRLPQFKIVGGEKKGLRLSELNGLNELTGDIGIRGLENVRDARVESKAANLMAKQYLHDLTLSWREGSSQVDESNTEEEEILLEGLQPHPELRGLTIEGYSGGMFPGWMTMGNMVTLLPNLVRIDLKDCPRCQHLPPSLDQLPFLKFLKLVTLHRVECIVDDNNNLHLARKKSSSSSSLFFPSLEKLVINDFPNLEGWWRRAAGTGTGREEEERESLSFPRLKELDIFACPKLTSIPMHLPQFDELTIGTVPEKLVRHLLTTTTTTTVATTEGSEISSSSFTSSPLSQLRILSISAIKDLESLTEEAVRNLTSLECLEIRYCPRLSHVVAVSEEEGLTSLRSLSIDSCGSLTSLSPPKTQFHLPTLQNLKIDNCKNLDLSGDGVYWQGLNSLLKLEIDRMPSLVSLPVGLPRVTTLQHLGISDCPSLTALPDWISNLTSLQRLEIKKCPLLSERCRRETGEDWPKISHIRKIIVSR